ncbi:uncharacterized protein LOC116204893 [Punica granatum]|uniref:Uncharacterized protein LOC116204893 n=1 Tax=Punica granatum TaxID=22663 RepID=A0A218WKG0_PUNGR|nr:uncharacterized protein LOC116204893 [Punica granatum]XP_031393110.1 uncharacterized protein LOC116204893 [Punica granatum]XP_031393111.1 uncharacterized protein LOC116204893 [Punica granatum]OWM73314.1 hypothetical protein CDL15_Pgr001428 [Punica granatum]
MAVAFEGFSIREYASKMRSENVAKSWPFGGDAGKEQIESILPPITVTKFRWWLDELEAARPRQAAASDAAFQADDDVEGADKPEAPPSGCLVCGGLGAPSISSTLTAHAGNCLAMSEDQVKQSNRAKSKSKPPKKRSIVEIFAVAPQIETVANKPSSNGAGDASCSRNPGPISSKKKKKYKKKKSPLDKARLLPVDNTKKFKKKKKKKKKKKIPHALPAIEENAYKLKLKTASDRSINLNSSSDGMHTSSISDGSLSWKKSRVKSSSSHTKHEAITPSKFHERQNKLNVPVRGILKKQGKFLINDSDSHNAFHLEKHVKFLDNVEIQGSQENVLVNIQQSDGHATFSGTDKLIGSDEEFSAVEVTSGDDDDPICIEGGNQAQVTVEKEHLTDARDQGIDEHYPSPRHASPHSCRNSLLTESSSVSQVPKFCEDFHTSIKGKTVVIDDSSSRENSRFVSPIRGAQGTYTNIRLSGSTFGCNIDGPSHAVCGISMIRSPRTSSQPTPSRLFLNENLNGSFSLQSRSAFGDTGCRPLIYQQLFPQRPMSLIDGPFTPTDQWNPRPCSLTEECIYKDLWGLPLNSRGELIQMNSASSSGFVLNQLNNSGMVSGSSGSFPGQNLIGPSYADYDLRLKENHFAQRSRRRDLDLFPMYNSEIRGARPDVFWQNLNRQNLDRHVGPSHLLNTDLNLVNVSFNMCRGHGYDSVQHRKGLRMAFPSKENEDRVSPDVTPVTMRLMGKDVAVCRSNTRGSEDENVWTDKEIIIEHHPPRDRFTHATLQKSKGPVNLSFEPQMNLRRESPVKAPESLLLNPYINCRPDTVPQRDSIPASRRSSNAEQRPCSPMSFNFTDLREPLVTGHRQALPSLPHRTSQYIHWVPEPRCRPSPPHPRAPGFDFPFLQGDCGEYLQRDSLFQSPSKDLPPWLLHSSDRGRSTATAYSLPFPDAIHRNHPYQMPTNRFNSSTTLAAYGPVDPPSYLRSPFGSLPAVRPHLLEAVPGIEPVSAENVSCRNRINSRDRMKSPAFGVRTPDLCAKTKKRPAVKPVDPPMKINKMPNLGMLKQPVVDISLMRESYCSEIECSGGGAMGPDSNSGKSSSNGCLPDNIGAQKDGQANLTGTEKFKAKETVKLGPTKLSAGTRHILKPGQTVDHENSRPIHSMVPFDGTSNNIMIPESQTKSMKIYKI